MYIEVLESEQGRNAMFKLVPSCKDYIWGGCKLREEFGKDSESERIAESWELSCHPDGLTYIAGTKYDRKTLKEYIEQEGKQVLGKNCERFSSFPILVKFIDAKKPLSIQVHPGDQYAMEHEKQYGKTEMWYIVDCSDNAYLYYGFNREIDKEEFEQRIQNHTLLEVLNKVYVKRGDVFFIESTTIHAIGSGITVAEIQENSNVTYRVYDYGRVDSLGNPRPLHIEQAIEVTNRHPLMVSKSFQPHLGLCRYFNVDKMTLDGKYMKDMKGMVDASSFLHILLLSGNVTLQCGAELLSAKKGDGIFLPANSGEFVIHGVAEALFTTIPSSQE